MFILDFLNVKSQTRMTHMNK